MKFRLILYWVVISIILQTSCAEKQDANYLMYRTNSFILNADRHVLKDLDAGKAAVFYHDSTEKRAYIVQLSLNNDNIYFFDLDGNLIRRHQIKNLHKGPMWNFFIQNFNEYFFSHDDGKISISDSLNCKKIYSIDDSLDQTNFCYSLSPTSEFDVNPDSTTIMLLVNRNCDPSLPDFSECHFSTPCLGLFKIGKDSIRLKSAIGYYPQSFKKHYSYDHSPIHTTNKNIIVYGFADSDSIYSANINGGERHGISLNNLGIKFKPHEFVRDSMNGINYVERYFVESPAISAIKYDKWKNVYYVGIQDGINYHRDSIHTNTVADASSRIVVLDENFKKLKVIQFPAGRFKRLSQIIVTEKGVLIQLNNKRNISYETYNFV